MSGQTPRFSLNFFGGDSPGTFSDDSDKYTSEDRLTLDRVLAALENHTHQLTTPISDPSAALTLSLSTTGVLEAGTTYYYVISFIDADGLETVSGLEASIETPDLLAAPDAPQGETATGSATLTPGQYYYALTALSGDEESPLGTPTAVTVLTGENQVTLTLPALADATSFQVWRMKDTDPGWTRIATGTTAVTDDGSVAPASYGDPANTPPTASAGVDNYAVSVALTGADLVTVGSSHGWRIYRSTVSGSYGATALVHEVIERTDDLDPTSALLTSWLDDGDAPLTGSPKLFSSRLNIAPYTIEHADPLPNPIAYPPYYPLVGAGDVLYYNKAGVWTPFAGPGGAGPAGPAGPAGASGPAGPPGPAGDSITGTSTVLTTVDVPITGTWNAIFGFAAVSGGVYDVDVFLVIVPGSSDVVSLQWAGGSAQIDFLAFADPGFTQEVTSQPLDDIAPVDNPNLMMHVRGTISTDVTATFSLYAKTDDSSTCYATANRCTLTATKVN